MNGRVATTATMVALVSVVGLAPAATGATQPASPVTVETIVVNDAVDAALQLSQRFVEDTSVLNAWLVRHDALADAVVGMRASSFSEPLLLLTRGGLTDGVSQELDRVLRPTFFGRPQPREVSLVGGPVPVPESTRARLEEQGYAVTRVAGEDRMATSVAAHDPNRCIGVPTTPPCPVLVVNAGHPGDGGRGLADGVLAGAFNDSLGPILLTDGTTLPPGADVVVGSSPVSTPRWLVGGPAVLSLELEAELEGRRFAGPNRFETMRAVLDARRQTVGIVVVADTPEGLMIGAVANSYEAQSTAVILAAGPSSLGPVSAEVLAENCPKSEVLVIGSRPDVDALAAEVADVVNRACG